MSSKSAKIICIDFKWREFLLDVTWHFNAIYMPHIFKIIPAVTAALWLVSPKNFCAQPDKSLNFCSIEVEATFPSDSSCLPLPYTQIVFSLPMSEIQGFGFLQALAGQEAFLPPGLLVHLSVDCSLPVYTNFRNINFRNLEYYSRNLGVSRTLEILELEENQILRHLNPLWDKTDHLFLTQL